MTDTDLIAEVRAWASNAPMLGRSVMRELDRGILLARRVGDALETLTIERDAAEKHARMRASESEDLERERDALAAEVDRLQLVHAGQARLALSAIFLADIDDDEGTQAFVDEWKRHHAAQALRDAAERWDWTEVPGGAPPVDRWLRAEADRLAPKAPDHNEQEQ